MEFSDNIFTELRQVAPAVANIGNNNPYTVPMGYFDLFPERIIEKIKSPIRIVPVHPYSVPTGYFDNLGNNILSKIKEAEQIPTNGVSTELETIAPLLNTINKRNVYAVPPAYFERLQPNIQPENIQTKVIPLRGAINKWLNYAAAASVIVILSTASYLYINHHSESADNSLTIEQRLAALNDDEIFNYLKNDLGDTDPDNVISIEEDPKINDLLLNISDEEIEDFYRDAENSQKDGSEEIIKGI